MPRVYYLEAHIDIAGAWEDLLKYLNQVMRALKIPVTFYRGEDVGMASGIALVVEQAPLLTRARNRRRPAALYETAIARTILTCAGTHFGKPALVASAQKGSLALGWPQPSVTVPTQDNLDLLKCEIEAGFKSLVMAVGEWYSVDREAAFQLLEQIEEDNEELKKRAPSLAPQPPPELGEDGEPLAQGGQGEPEATGDDGQAADDDADNYTRGLKEAIVDL